MKEAVNQIFSTLLFVLPFILPILLVLLLKKFRMFRNIASLLLSLGFDVILMYVYFGDLYAEFWIPLNIAFAVFGIVFPYILFIHRKDMIEYNSTAYVPYFEHLDETMPGWREEDKRKIDSYSFRTGNYHPTEEDLDEFIEDLGPTDDKGNSMYVWKKNGFRSCDRTIEPRF